MSHFPIAQALADACGADPGAVCSLVYDLSGNDTAARISDLAARPVKVAIILVAALVVNRMVRRWLDRAVQGWLERRSAAADQAVEKRPRLRARSTICARWRYGAPGS